VNPLGGPHTNKTRCRQGASSTSSVSLPSAGSPHFRHHGCPGWAGTCSAQNLQGQCSQPAGRIDADRPGYSVGTRPPVLSAFTPSARVVLALDHFFLGVPGDWHVLIAPWIEPSTGLLHSLFPIALEFHTCLSAPPSRRQPNLRSARSPANLVQDAEHIGPLLPLVPPSTPLRSLPRPPSLSTESSRRRRRDALASHGLSIQSCRKSTLLALRSPSPSTIPQHVVPAVATPAVGIGRPAVRPGTHPLLPPPLPPPSGRPGNPLLCPSGPLVDDTSVSPYPGSRPLLQSSPS